MLLFQTRSTPRLHDMCFQSPPHRGRCCCIPVTQHAGGDLYLSVPSSSGKMLLSDASQPVLVNPRSFSPLLIGEDAAVGRVRPRPGSPAALSVPSSSGKMLLSGRGGARVGTLASFSPLLIGEDAAVPSRYGTHTALPRLSVPSSSGKMLLFWALRPIHRLQCDFQSPPHRGRCCCVTLSSPLDTRLKFLSVPSSSGKMLLYHGVSREAVRVRLLSVPSSSGKMLLLTLRPCVVTASAPFSPLLIGEDAAVTRRLMGRPWEPASFSPLLIGEDAAVGPQNPPV